jgi:hypothetical protein
MSESNDPWDSIKPTPPQPVPNPYSSPGPEPKKGDPGYAPLLSPPGWRGDMITQLAIVGLVVSIISAVVGLLCCGLLPAAGLAPCIPAFVMAQRDLKTFAGTVHPELIDKLTLAKNLALAGIIVSSVATVLGLLCIGLNLVFVAISMAAENR